MTTNVLKSHLSIPTTYQKLYKCTPWELDFIDFRNAVNYGLETCVKIENSEFSFWQWRKQSMFTFNFKSFSQHKNKTFLEFTKTVIKDEICKQEGFPDDGFIMITERGILWAPSKEYTDKYSPIHLHSKYLVGDNKYVLEDLPKYD